MGAGLCKTVDGVAWFDDPMKLKTEDSRKKVGNDNKNGRRDDHGEGSVAGSELLDTESLMNASEAVIFGHPMSRQSFTHSNATTHNNVSLGGAVNDLGLGQVCAALSHIEDLQRMEVDEFTPEHIQADDPRYPAAQFFMKVGIRPERLSVVEMCKLLTHRKVNECNKVKPEWHEESNAAFEGYYKNQSCMHCEAMLSKEREWVPHWSVPPGPPVESILDPALGSSIASYSTCASGMSAQSLVNLATQRKCDDNHLFLEYLLKSPEVQLLTSVVSPDTLVVSKYTRQVVINKRLCRELAILKSIIHQNISPLLDAIHEAGTIVTFTVFVPCGMLYKPFDPAFKMDTLRLQSLGLLQGLHYLHFLGIVHGNIKPPNVLVDSNGRAVLCDAGTLHGFRDKDSDMFGFTSPSENKIPVADVWSLGVLMYCMAVGKPPFPCEKPAMVRRYLMKSDPDFRIIPCMILRDLVRGMMERRDSKRMAVRDCLDHPFFTEVSTGIPEYPPVTVSIEEIQKAITNNPMDLTGGGGSGIRNVSRKFPGRRLAAEDESGYKTSVTSVLDLATMEKAVTLNLSCLALTAVPDRAFQCTWVTKVDLSMNNLTVVPVEIGQFEYLETLSLRKNELTIIPVEIVSIPTLTHLDLSGNTISTLPEVPPTSLLNTISLDNNCFNMVPDTLTDIEGLVQIHVRGNRILHLPRRWKWSACKLHINNSPGIVKEFESMDIPKGLEIVWNKIYPDKIAEDLYLGSLRTVQDEYVLRELKIDHIITVGKNLGIIDPLPENIDHTRSLLDSSHDLQIHQLLDDMATVINESLKGGHVVVVHCLSGQNRSVVVACAYFIKYCGMTFKEAIQCVKVGRPAANPNEGFRQHLIDYEAILHGTRLQADDIEARPNATLYPPARREASLSASSSPRPRRPSSRKEIGHWGA
eukprot:TRINITY_DN46894_c0_g1_i1.p1 TRINITY_DN46894_c0_g1~~TRINITY_DN46894_c0_g1_i1.p1  ORF type:complete len:921 (+),score=110.77 TRINITY_DN46894_c0_g1_i1:117-2879(+)